MVKKPVKNPLIPEKLKAAAGHKIAAPAAKATTNGAATANLVFFGGQWPPEVRKALKLAEAYSGKNLKQLLSEAINATCAKYGVPEPCGDEA